MIREGGADLSAVEQLSSVVAQLSELCAERKK